MSIIRILTSSLAALALASTTAASPASAGGYYYRSGPDAGAIAGAAIAGMAVGAMVGAAASQPHDGYYDQPYGYGDSYDPAQSQGGYYDGYDW